ncbi:MAG: hypothetical protein WD467_00815 [Candidatus Saccharimonadales bacterium]
MFIAITGSNPELSLAELERIYTRVTPQNNASVCFDGEIWPHLGGTSKIGEIITTLDTVDLSKVMSYLEAELPDTLGLNTTKFDIGLSFYGKRVRNYRSLVFTLKKQWRQRGLKPRFILGKQQDLSSAQVIHNRLTAADSHEIIISAGAETTIIARTVWVQDIERYTLRDMERPRRDLEVGMLPPKLAQIMINLAGGHYVYDSFCGSGVVLQEALLMGKRAGGSDLASVMVENARVNLDWLSDRFNTPAPEVLSVADARTLTLPEGVDTIVTEGYLGPGQHGSATREDLVELAESSSQLMTVTLKNLQPQLPSGATLCIALPAWAYRNEVILPPLIDTVEKLGYNRIRLNSVSTNQLLYLRDSQYVGRQLILLEKK